jgi:hypothetical protein
MAALPCLPPGMLVGDLARAWHGVDNAPLRRESLGAFRRNRAANGESLIARLELARVSRWSGLVIRAATLLVLIDPIYRDCVSAARGSEGALLPLASTSSAPALSSIKRAGSVEQSSRATVT